MAFSTLKVYGNCDINYVWSKKATLTATDISSLTEKGIYSPSWDNTTVALATFMNTLNASNISETVYGYLIHRQRLDEDVRYKVAEVDSTITNIKDFNIGSRANYQYFITPIYMKNGNKILGEPILTDNIETNFDSWSIISLTPTNEENSYIVDTDNIWNFYVYVEGGTFSINDDKSITSGLGKFPKTYVGETDYLTGNVKCLIGNVDCEIDYQNDDINKLRQWRKFCNNGKLKLLRDIKGHIIPCEITDASYDSDDKFGELQTTISFNFTQLDDSDNIAVYAIENI